MRSWSLVMNVDRAHVTNMKENRREWATSVSRPRASDEHPNWRQKLMAKSGEKARNPATRKTKALCLRHHHVGYEVRQVLLHADSEVLSP